VNRLRQIVNRIASNNQQASSTPVGSVSIDNEQRAVHHIIILVLCVIILTASLLFRVNEAELHLFGFKSPLYCFLYHTVGIKCALCGLTRSFGSLAHGNFRQAINFHLLGPPIFLLICFQLPYRIYALIIRPKRMNRKLIKTNSIFAVTILIAIFVNWLVYLGGLIL